MSEIALACAGGFPRLLFQYFDVFDVTRKKDVKTMAYSNINALLFLRIVIGIGITLNKPSPLYIINI